MNRNKILIMTAAALLLVGALGFAHPVLATHVEPVYYPDNPTCEDLGYDFGYKPQPEPPPSGTYSFPYDVFNTVTLTTDGIYVDWESTLGIDAVIVKGGPNANVYIYDPEEFSDDGLHSPVNPNNDTFYAISHVDFCYDYEVTVGKTADTSYTRDYDWSISKTGSTDALLLSAGQVGSVDYEVTVDVVGSTDSDWAVDGEITIDNFTPYEATIESVSDELSVDGAVAVDCGVGFPYALASGDTLVCTYSTDLPGANDQTNTAIVITSGIVGGGEASASVVFGDPTNEVDECVVVTDDQYGDLFGGAPVCADSAPHTANYTQSVGPYSLCGDYEFVNVASYDSGEGETGEASWTVTVSVVGCQDAGCSLTQGYWKTHSQYGPAPYDDTWAIIGEDTPFFLSGQSYYEVLWTNPQGGNAYYILAHQYIAAQLNFLNGSDPTDAQAAFDAATALFNTYTPAQVAAAKGKSGNALRAQFIALAGTLDAYNNGDIGPGHCSE